MQIDDHITDDELLELETLLRIEGLSVIDDDTSKNYEFLKQSFDLQKYDGELIISGFKGVILEGGARSSKTWSVIYFILYICLFVEKECTINIIRETYNEFKTTLYLDLKKILNLFGLDNPFERAKDVQSFKIGKNQINFIGADQPKKVHGATSDYTYFNEMLPIPEIIFTNLIMRCSKFWIGDFNPSVTEHYVFNKVITRPDVGHLQTTFRDNPNVPLGQKIEILGFEPWLPGSYEVVNNVLMYNGEEMTKDNYPPPHPTNIDNGTADEFMWKVYGLGLRGAMKGVIFQNITYIPEFPDMGYIHSNDFGFTTDPNALVKYAEDDRNIYIELRAYEPIENPEDLSDFMDALGVERDLPLPCDSSDKYTGENKGTVEMVKGLKKLGWKAFKISKTKSVMYHLVTMKKKKIHIVKNHLYMQAKKEAENYRMKEINGIAINQPIDKFNHMWDAARYGHMAWNAPATVHKTDQETIKSINY